MSGGSFDYLYQRKARELFVHYQDEIKEMEKMLRKMGFDVIANDTLEILLLFEMFEKEVDRRVSELSEVWKAVEWYSSGDWGGEKLIKVAKEYLERKDNRAAGGE